MCSVILAGMLLWPAVVSGGKTSGPSLELDPSGPFEDGDAFTLEASGFEPGADLGATVCASGALDTSADDRSEEAGGDLQLCDQEFRLEEADSAGDAEFVFEARRMLQTPKGVYDCAAEGQGCIVGAASISDFEPVAIPLPMEAAAPSARPQVTVDPVGQDEQASVQVSVSGVTPDTATDVVVCAAAGDGFDGSLCGESTPIPVGPSGEGSAVVPLGWVAAESSAVAQGQLAPLPEPLDCSGPGRPCVLVVGRYSGSPVVARIPMGSSATG